MYKRTKNCVCKLVFNKENLGSPYYLVDAIGTLYI